MTQGINSGPQQLPIAIQTVRHKQPVLKLVLSPGYWYSPPRVIPITEGDGLILSIGEWVMRSALRQLKIGPPLA